MQRDHVAPALPSRGGGGQAPFWPLANSPPGYFCQKERQASQDRFKKRNIGMPVKPQIVRYGELQPCKTAFIDAHTPGSDQKENFTIIGGGVSESPDQHVHISIEHGFNIGAAGQPPNCRNSLHDHRTAEAFFVLSGRWRFFWGEKGDAGEVIMQEG